MEELIPITLFMCVTAVLILRPISKRVGLLLEAMTRERMQQVAPPVAQPDPQLARVATLMERLNSRLDMMEERLDFTERLIGSGRRSRNQDSVGVLDDIGLGRESFHSLHG